MKPLTGKNVRVREGQWHFRFNLKGAEQTGPTGLEGTKRNQKAAELFAKNVRQEMIRKGTPHSEGAAFDEVAGRFISWCRDSEYRGKPNTASRIHTSFKSAVYFFGRTPVGEIDAGAIERYKTFRIQEHGVRDITLRHDLHALSVFFKKYAIKMGLAKSNPVEGVTIPSDRDAIREHVLTAEEEDAYFDAAFRLHVEHRKSHPDALANTPDLARLILEQGARPEEILAARKDHYDHKAKTLLIAGGKTRAARRLLNLTAVSIEILSRRLASEGPWLFPSDRRPGQHLSKLNCTHDRICREAGVSFVLYDLRHTFATRAIAAGNDVPTVAAIMGHAGLRTIYRYVHPTAESQKLAMERMEGAQTRKKLKIVV